MKKENAQDLGKELIKATAILNDTRRAAATQKVIEKARTLEDEGIAAFNKYVKLVNTTQLMNERAARIVAIALNEFNDIYQAAFMLYTLVQSDIQMVSSPVIMTAAQYKAWEKNTVKTEYEQMLADRIQLYGVAILNRDSGICINSKGKYHQIDLLAEIKKQRGVEYYTSPTAKGEKLRAKHLETKTAVVKKYLMVCRYNKLIEAIAEAAEVPEYNRWAVDLSNLDDGIKAYNNIIALLAKEALKDNVTRIAYTRDQLDRLLALIDIQMCPIADSALEVIITDEDQATLNELAANYKKIVSPLAESFYSSSEQIALLDLVEEYEKQCDQEGNPGLKVFISDNPNVEDIN